MPDQVEKRDGDKWVTPPASPPPAALDPRDGWVAGAALETLQRRLSALEAEVEMHARLAALEGDVTGLKAEVAKLKAHVTYSTPD